MVLVVVNDESFAEQISYIVAFAMFGAVGAVILSRDPRNVIGGLLLAASTITASSFATGELFTWFARRGVADSWLVILGFLNTFGWLFGILPAIFLLPLLFPDGRLPSRRWRPYLWTVIGLLAVFAVLILFGAEEVSGSNEDLTVANPLYLPMLEDLSYVDPFVVVLYPLLFGLSVLSLVLRFRRADAEQRQQIKWVVFGLVTALVGTIASMFVSESSVLSSLIGGAALLLFPLSIGVSILRYRLYDLDLVVKKALVAGTIALVVVAAYAGLVWLAGTVATDIGSSLAFFLVALALGWAFRPVARFARRLSDRLVYGRRATPYEVLSEFSERVGDAYSDADVLPRMARVLGEGVGAERADVWLAVDRQLRDVATWPETGAARPPIALGNGSVPAIPEAERSFPVEQGGELLGVLSIRKPAADPVSPADEKLVADLAGQAGLVLRNVRLTEELRARLDDLTAAQKRLVSAQDQERRRLERNIHDGAQQQLVALAVKARLARTLTERDPAKAGEVLSQIEQETQAALEDLRDLARGIYPPLLADGGLAAAVPAQARKAPLPVHVEVTVPRRHPQEIEAAVYFSVLEGLQNVAKYAEASQAWVEIREQEGILRFEVRDDGRGFDPVSSPKGTGLQGISDRLQALGGELTLSSAPREGTILAGWVPTS
jgi:signal transduction histidine kinase